VDISFRIKAAAGYGLALIALFVMGSTQVAGQSFPAQYANALQKAQYTVYAGDVNGDGTIDLLFLPKKVFVIIDYDIPFPVVAKPISAPFVLLSSAGGYTLTSNPTAAILNSSVWQKSSYHLTYGDTLADGSVNMLAEAAVSGSPSFLVTSSSTTGLPVLLENLNTNTLGVDLSSANTSASLQDINHDGRADLVVYSGGLLTAAFIAASDGTFSRPPQSVGGPALAAWRSFCAALTLGDVASANSFLSTGAKIAYGPAVTGIGATMAITTMTQQWSEPILIINASDYAEFAVTQPESGVTKTHLVGIIYEYGNWVIEAM
jgi:hypothetical protein